MTWVLGNTEVWMNLLLQFVSLWQHQFPDPVTWWWHFSQLDQSHNHCHTQNTHNTVTTTSWQHSLFMHADKQLLKHTLSEKYWVDKRHVTLTSCSGLINESTDFCMDLFLESESHTVTVECWSHLAIFFGTVPDVITANRRPTTLDHMTPQDKEPIKFMNYSLHSPYG